MRRRVRRPWHINEETFYALGRLGRRAGTSRERLINDILSDYIDECRLPAHAMPEWKNRTLRRP
jgi:hypothetical protein